MSDHCWVIVGRAKMPPQQRPKWLVALGSHRRRRYASGSIRSLQHGVLLVWENTEGTR